MCNATGSRLLLHTVQQSPSLSMSSVEATSTCKGFVIFKQTVELLLLLMLMLSGTVEQTQRASWLARCLSKEGAPPRWTAMLRLFCGETVQLSHLVQHAAGHKLQ